MRWPARPTALRLTEVADGIGAVAARGAVETGSVPEERRIVAVGAMLPSPARARPHSPIPRLDTAALERT
ncbi:hypothetical protein C5F51_36105 [Nocardia nova]|uniref:Uncharacterized protein n=1 Tax=Nocardia nova TaxID=37330 RepID=A0A2S5ZUF5_9NOCA|nr:hypothetical protein C5F51_36105 [Nocardia nova]